MALTFVLGWEAHALWSKWGADDEHTHDASLEDKDEDSGIFSEEGQSMLSEEETEVILSYQIKQGDTFSSVLERYGVRFPIKTSRECAEHFDISKIRVGRPLSLSNMGNHSALSLHRTAIKSSPFASNQKRMWWISPRRPLPPSPCFH